MADLAADNLIGFLVARQAADAAQPRRAREQVEQQPAVGTLDPALGLAALNFVLVVCAAAAQAAGARPRDAARDAGAPTSASSANCAARSASRSRGARQETAQTFATFQQALVQQGAEATRTQNAQIDAFAQQLTLLQKTLADTLTTQLQGLSESNARRLAEVRATHGDAARAAAADQHRQARRDAQDGRREAAEHAGSAPGRELQAGGRPAGAGAQGPGRDADAGAAAWATCSAC